MYQFCNGDIDKFVLLLRKCVYPYEYMDSWERFNETSLLDKEAFDCELNLENCTDEDYTYYKKVFKEFELKNLGDCHDFYVQCDTLMCIKYMKYILSASGLAWEACLRKTGVKLELLIDIDMLLMVQNGIRGGICQVIHRYVKANNKYMKNYDKNIESSYLMYLDANNLYGWAMSQKLSVGGFEWVKDLSQFKEDFIKNYDEYSSKGCFLQVDVEYPKKTI